MKCKSEHHVAIDNERHHEHSVPLVSHSEAVRTYDGFAFSAIVVKIVRLGHLLSKVIRGLIGCSDLFDGKKTVSLFSVVRIA